MKDIKISIIIPLYNAEKYIERCLDSLINQTLKEIEIIIINDKSTDKGLEICYKYAKRDKRIKIYNNKENIGFGLSRNYGLKIANGEFIAFVDNDDYVDRNFYEKTYNKIIETDADICFGEYKKILDKEGNKVVISKIPFDNDVVETKNILHSMLLLDTNKKISSVGSLEVTVWQSIYKKSILEKNNIVFCSERKYLAEDILFNFNYLLNSNKASFVRGTYYNYCFNEMSFTHKYIPDRLKKSKLLKNKLMELTANYKELDFSKEIMSLFLGNVRVAIRQEIDDDTTTKIKLEKIRAIINDEDVIEALRHKTRVSFRKEMFNFLIKAKQARLLIVLHKLSNKMSHITTN